MRLEFKKGNEIVCGYDVCFFFFKFEVVMFIFVG